MLKIYIFLITCCLSFYSVAENRQCEHHPDIVESCYDVEGKLGFYNGSPSVRIELSSGRVLGISEGRFYKQGYDNLPANILKGLNFGLTLNGNFKVCPFTIEQPKVMRLVCVQSVKNAQLISRD